MRRFSQLLMAIAAIHVMAMTLAAGTITATVTGLVAYGQVEMSLDNGAWENHYAGLISLTRTGGTADVDLLPDPVNFVAFCVEPREGISLNQTYTWEQAPMTSAPTGLGGMTELQATQLRMLMALAFPNFSSNITGLQAAAIQIAIWEIVEETSGTLDVTTGSIRFRNPTVSNSLTFAQSLLDQVVDGAPELLNIEIMIHQSHQDLMFQSAFTPGGEENPIPEPATVSMFGLGLIALGMARRKMTANR
jgi:hypothetical protein